MTTGEGHIMVDTKKISTVMDTGKVCTFMDIKLMSLMTRRSQRTAWESSMFLLLKRRFLDLLLYTLRGFDPAHCSAPPIPLSFHVVVKTVSLKGNANNPAKG